MKLSTLGVAVLVLTCAAATASADDIISAGSSWEYTFSDPGAGWQTGGGGGIWSVGNAPFGNTGGGDFGANTIWGADGSDGTDVWVRQMVDLTGLTVSGAIWNLGVDNGFALYVNGVLIQAANAEGFTFRWEYGGALSNLVSGINWIGVELEDHGGLTAFDMQITASVRPVPEPGTIALLGAGVVGLFARLRRRAA